MQPSSCQWVYVLCINHTALRMFCRKQGDIPTSVSDDPSEKNKGQIFGLFFFCFFHRWSVVSVQNFFLKWMLCFNCPSGIYQANHLGIKFRGEKKILFQILKQHQTFSVWKQMIHTLSTRTLLRTMGKHLMKRFVLKSVHLHINLTFPTLSVTHISFCGR